MRAVLLAIAVLAGPARAEGPAVVVDIAPVQSLVAMVMGDLGRPELLLDPASDPHGFQLRPSQARSLARADLLVWMGPELTPWLDRARANLSSGADSLALLAAPGVPLRIEAEQAHGDDHGHGSLDPHAWLDPLNAAFYLPLIAEALAGLDPENAASYRRNAATAAARLGALARELAPELEPVGHVSLVAGHDAYAYLLQRFGVQLSGALSDAGGNPPGAARLRELRDTLRGDGRPVCVLLEPGMPDDLVDVLALAPPPRIVRPDAMGRDLPQGPALYEAMLRGLAQALARCAAPAG